MNCFEKSKKNLNKIFEKIFNHPKEVCMTYTEHAYFSLKLSFIFLKASFKGISHAFYPEIYKSYAQDTTENINYLLRTNGCKSK